MLRLKKIIRLLGLVLLILLALSGIGAIPVISTREKYLDNEIKIEQVDKEEDESEADDVFL